MAPDVPPVWLAALEARHLADLRIAEVTRALRALSSSYVERRHSLARGAALDSAGKRAAFALFYAPIHYLVVRHIVATLRPDEPETIVDLGCGTGAAGAAWSLACDRPPRLVGIDRHPWAVEETRWMYRQLQLAGHAKQGDAARFRPPRGRLGVVAAYLLNELADDVRAKLIDTLIEASRHGASVLILEPIARRIAPWWEDAEVRIANAGGRADEWEITIERPPIVALLDQAAGLDHRTVKARSLFIGHNR
jgi:SAM-dependent methyltransferase